MRGAAPVLIGAQLVLAVTLAAAVVGWRDPDPAAHLAIPLLGAIGLAVSLAVIRNGSGWWVVAAVDGWFVTVGLMLGQSIAGARALMDNFDPPPETIALLTRLQSWLDPSVQHVVAAAFVLAGLVGVVASIAGRRPLHRDAGA